MIQKNGSKFLNNKKNPASQKEGAGIEIIKYLV